MSVMSGAGIIRIELIVVDMGIDAMLFVNFLHIGQEMPTRYIVNRSEFSCIVHIESDEEKFR